MARYSTLVEPGSFVPVKWTPLIHVTKQTVRLNMHIRTMIFYLVQDSQRRRWYSSCAFVRSFGG
jgi:hypothetical protein